MATVNSLTAAPKNQDPVQLSLRHEAEVSEALLRPLQKLEAVGVSLHFYLHVPAAGGLLRSSEGLRSPPKSPEGDVRSPCVTVYIYIHIYIYIYIYILTYMYIYSHVHYVSAQFRVYRSSDTHHTPCKAPHGWALPDL